MPSKTNLLLAIAGLFLLAIAAIWQSNNLYYKAQLRDVSQVIFIAPGTGAKAILQQLQHEKLAPPFWQVALPIYLNSSYRNLKAGEYQIDSGLSLAEIMAKIQRGEVVIHKLTIPEGWNVRQVRDLLMAEPLLSGELPAEIAEGSALPETYHFTRGQQRGELLQQMQAAMRKTSQQIWQQYPHRAPLDTLPKALIMASIVERETGLAAERPQVAAVFVNRLNIGMRLQSDPTAIYGIEQQFGPLNRKPTGADMTVDTPWNSYTRDGLPPTPIACPGMDSLRAVLNPAPIDALYFVASGTGGHIFADSLAEHNRNIAHYRAMLRAQ
jgi:UPF0755 protein